MMSSPTEFSPVIAPSTIAIHQFKRSALFFAPVIALYTGLAAGTAGAYTPTNLPLLSEFAVKPLSGIRHNRDRRTASLRPALMQIRTVFGLTMTEFAHIFDVSRPAAYAWFEGTAPKAEVLDRIWKLHAFANQLEQMHIHRISLLKRKPLIEGATLLDILRDQKRVGEALLILKEGAVRDKTTTRSIGLGRRPRIATAEDISLTTHATT